MSTSGSRPPGQPQRKLVLRRKTPAGHDSQVAALGAANDEPQPPAPTLAPPPTLLPRAMRPIEHSAELFAPRPVSGGDSPAGGRSVSSASSASSASRAGALLTPRSGATPIPLPSRVSVAPVVASVPSNPIPPVAPKPPARGRGVLVIGGIAVAAVLGGAILLSARPEPRPAAAGPAPHDVVAAGTSPDHPTVPPRPETKPDRVTSVEDLPRAPPPPRPPAMAAARPLRAAASASAHAGDVVAQGPDTAARASSGAPAPSENGSAQPAELELPNAPPPPADPLIQAVQQSIDDGRK